MAADAKQKRYRDGRPNFVNAMRFVKVVKVVMGRGS